MKRTRLFDSLFVKEKKKGNDLDQLALYVLDINFILLYRLVLILSCMDRLGSAFNAYHPCLDWMRVITIWIRLVSW